MPISPLLQLLQFPNCVILGALSLGYPLQLYVLQQYMHSSHGTIFLCAGLKLLLFLGLGWVLH